MIKRKKEMPLKSPDYGYFIYIEETNIISKYPDNLKLMRQKYNIPISRNDIFNKYIYTNKTLLKNYNYNNVNIMATIHEYENLSFYNYHIFSHNFIYIFSILIFIFISFSFIYYLLPS